MSDFANSLFLTEQERAQVKNRDLVQLQKTLGYTFHDEGLLQEALCHSSFANEHGMHQSNERLEFLGDSVLNYAVACALFKQYPDSAEGELTRMRSELVRESSLYSRALTLRVPELLLHGHSMQTPNLPKSICADAVEAIIGAICLDGGTESVARVVERLFLQETRDTPNSRPVLDPKSHLQAILQAQGIPLPSYELLSVKGPSHMPVFEIRLRVNGIECTATGKTRKGAESVAAAEMIQKIQPQIQIPDLPEAAVTKPDLTKDKEQDQVVSAVPSPLVVTIDEILRDTASSPAPLQDAQGLEALQASQPSQIAEQPLAPSLVSETPAATPVTPAAPDETQVTPVRSPNILEDLDDFEPQPSPEYLQRGLSQYASVLTADPALIKSPRFPKREIPEKEAKPEKHVPPHPVLTQSDLRRIVQMAHKGAE